MIDSNNLPPNIRRCHEAALRQKEGVRTPPTASQKAEFSPVAPKGTQGSGKGGLAKPRGRKEMNKTEASFAMLLEERKRVGEITRYEYEGISLRWPDGMVFNPDFAVWRPDIGTTGPRPLLLIETKGSWIRDDALVKFRAARAHWPEFHFEMWQKKKGAWSKLL